MRRIIMLAGLIMACGHTDPYQVEDPPLLGPLEEPGYRLTYNLGFDVGFNWSSDGSALTYSFNSCIGILLRDGGTRRKELCDTRSAPVPPDFNMGYPTAVAPSSDGRVLFYQTARIASRGLPYGGALVLADTSTWLNSRTVLLTLPMVIADSLINGLTEIQWTGPNSFIAAASRVVGDGSPDVMLHNPRMLVRGEIAGGHATLTKIPGTESARSWAFGTNGEILFVKGEWVAIFVFDKLSGIYQPPPEPSFIGDSIIYQIPAGGGVPTVFMEAPVRLRSLSCAGESCLALSSNFSCIGSCPRDTPIYALMTRLLCQPFSCPAGNGALYAFNLRTHHFQLVPGIATSTWITPRLSPTRPEFVYAVGGDLFRRDFTPP